MLASLLVEAGCGEREPSPGESVPLAATGGERGGAASAASAPNRVGESAWILYRGSRAIGHQRRSVSVAADGSTWIHETSELIDARPQAPRALRRESRRRFDGRGALTLVCLREGTRRWAFASASAEAAQCGGATEDAGPLASRETLLDALWEDHLETLLAATAPVVTEFDSECGCDQVYHLRARTGEGGAGGATVGVVLERADGIRRLVDLDARGIARLSADGVEFVRGAAPAAVGVREEDVAVALSAPAVADCKRAEMCAFVVFAARKLPSTTRQLVVALPGAQLIFVARQPRSWPAVRGAEAVPASAGTLNHPTALRLNSIIARESSPRARVERAVALLAQTLALEDAAELATAQEVFARGGGDCTEWALALVALAGAAGVPARVAGGYAATVEPPALVPHAWVEVYLDQRWVAVDPAWQQVPADATHLAVPAGLLSAASLVAPP